MDGIILSPAYTNLMHKKLILKLYLLYFSSAIYCDCPVRFAVIIIIGPAILAVWDHPFVNLGSTVLTISTELKVNIMYLLATAHQRSH